MLPRQATGFLGMMQGMMQRHKCFLVNISILNLHAMRQMSFMCVCAALLAYEAGPRNAADTAHGHGAHSLVRQKSKLRLNAVPMHMLINRNTVLTYIKSEINTSLCSDGLPS